MATLEQAIGALCRLSGRVSPEDQALLMPALVLLSECLAESREQAEPITRKQAQLARLAELEEQLQGHDAGERAAAIRQRLGLSRSHYYRLRLQAQLCR